MFYASLFLIYVSSWQAEASFRQGVVHPDICETKECHDAADHIKKWMNPAFKPCEDFYEFTCGYWHSPDNTIVNKIIELLKEPRIIRYLGGKAHQNLNLGYEPVLAYLKSHRDHHQYYLKHHH